jgi:hypothetical protein
MKTIGDHQNGVPKELAPFAGQEFVAFLDESFFKFFGLQDRTGNICYASVALPTRTYTTVCEEMQELFAEYQHTASLLG